MSNPDTAHLPPASRVYRSPELFGRIGVYLDGPSLAKVLVLEKAHFAERASWLWRRATKRAILHVSESLLSGISAEENIAYSKRRAIYLPAVEHIDWHAEATHIVRVQYRMDSLRERCQVCSSDNYIDEKESQAWMQKLQRDSPNLRSICYFGGLDDHMWEVRQVEQAQMSRTKEAISIETEVIVDARLGSPTGEWEYEYSDFHHLADNPAFRWKLIPDLYDLSVSSQDLASSLSGHWRQMGGGTLLAGLAYPARWGWARRGLDSLTKIIREYNIRAHAPLSHIKGAFLPFDLETFRHFILAVGTGAIWIDIWTFHPVSPREGHCCLILDDLAEIVELVRAHCPLLECLSIDLYDARPGRTLSGEHIPITALGLGGRLREIRLILCPMERNAAAGRQPANFPTRLLGLLARNLACLGRRHATFVLQGEWNCTEPCLDGRTVTLLIEEYVEALHRIEPRRLDHVRFADWDYLGINEPADLLRLEFDDQDRPISFRMQKALREISEVNDWFATLEQEKESKRAKRDAALDQVKQMTLRGPMWAKRL